MLLALWSPKGGSGTSVVAAACAVVLARHGGARLVDLDGDQPAIFGLAADPPTGVADWLAAGPEAPTEALERLAIEAAGDLVLIPRGTAASPLRPPAAAEAGAALGVALRDGPVPTVLDLGTAIAPSARALLEVADAAAIVVRGCYLALRRAVGAPGLARTSGVAAVDEAGRSLRAKDCADVLDRPLLAQFSVRAPVARAVDAGVFGTRMPETLVRPASEMLDRLGLLGARGRAA
jgi:hypothetical protein